MSRKNLIRILSVIALAFAYWIYPSFAAKAQDVMCTITGVRVYMDYAEVMVEHCNATEAAEISMAFQAELGNNAAPAASDEPEPSASEPEESKSDQAVEYDVIEFEAGDTKTISEGYWISGDVDVNGQDMHDSDGATALVVKLHEEAEVFAEWGATATNEPLDESTLEANVVVKDWPEQAHGENATAADAPQGETASSGWTTQEFPRLSENPIVVAWLARLQDACPECWPTFPNVPNPLVPDFRVVNENQVPDGAEYGQDDSPFCEYKQTCDWVVPGWHYRLISGDYKFTSKQFTYECRNTDAENRKGCLIILFNVMNESYTWRDQSVDNGFTVMGKYFNGDALEWAAWGLTSHASANMLNMPTMRNPNTGDVLNAGGNSANSGGNCGVQPFACGGVDATIIVHAGNEILAVAQTFVTE